MQQAAAGVTSVVLLVLFSGCQLHARTASTPPVKDILGRHQPGRGVDGLFGAMGSYATDLGMHALHLLLSGPDNLMLDEESFQGVP